MKYMLLIYSDEAIEASMNEAEQQANMGEYFAFTDHVREAGVMVAGEALLPTQQAATVRVNGGGEMVVSDGPFAETKEQLGGFYILDCETAEEAHQLAAKIPAAKHGAIEVRPLMVFN